MSEPAAKRTKLEPHGVDLIERVDVTDPALLPKELWQLVLLHSTIDVVSRCGLACSSLLGVVRDPGFVKQTLARVEDSSRKGAEQYWNRILDESSRDITKSSILEDLGPISVSATLTVCSFDPTWQDLINVLTVQTLSEEEAPKQRTAAAIALREVLQQRNLHYSVSDSEHFANLAFAAACRSDNAGLVSAICKLLPFLRLSHFPADSLLTIIQLVNRIPAALPASLNLLGALVDTSDQCGSAANDSGFVERICSVLETCLNDGAIGSDSIVEAIVLCANLVEAASESTAANAEVHLRRYISSTVPPLLRRFVSGVPFPFIINCCVMFNSMLRATGPYLKEMLVPFVREYVVAQDPQPATAAVAVLGVLCDLSDRNITALIKSNLPYILAKLDPSVPNQLREAVMFLIDRIPKFHIAALLPANAQLQPENPDALEPNPELEQLVSRLISTFSDPSLSQHALFNVEHLASSVPLPYNVFLGSRFEEVFNAAIEIVRRPGQPGFPEIASACDDLLGLLILHSRDNQSEFIYSKAKDLVAIFNLSLQPAPETTASAGSTLPVVLDETELTEWTDANKIAIACFASSALSNLLQRLPASQVTCLVESIPMAVRALSKWGFLDELMMLFWNFVELMPVESLAPHAIEFREVSKEAMKAASIEVACEAARWLADMERIGSEHSMNEAFNVEWIIPCMLSKLPPLQSSTCSSLSERAAAFRTLASVATNVGAKLKPHLQSLLDAINFNIDIIHTPSIARSPVEDMDQALAELTSAICSSLCAAVITVNQESNYKQCPELDQTIASLCRSLYKPDLLPQDLQSRVPLVFFRDEDARASLNRKLLLLGRAFMTVYGDERAAELFEKQFLDDARSIEYDVDALLEDIVEMAAL